MYKSIILPLAKQDIREAVRWYNDKQIGLGKRFAEQLRKTVLFIRKNPRAVAVRYDNVRTAIIDVFPYMIHYSVDESSSTIIISAVLSTYRSPKIWEERL
jgi:plasmid stabilization system protein ParE